ncbi:MAG: NADH-quinone oxidoreductase subunit H, partial [Acidimicrobiales bacterium]|nr:NADH-quinone oxidoreductase subunit H [Acidimicrobiales bacterium]
VILGAALLGAGTFVYVYLFKMVSHLQSRLGPMESGPHGSLQLMAEVLKFIQKEDVFPSRADRRVFAMAPVIVIMSTFLVYVVIPVGPRGVVSGFDVGVLYALAVSSISVIGILMAGWASANKYSLMGGLRAAGQLIAYELPLVLAVVGVVMQAGSLNLQTIVTTQARFKLFGFEGLGLFVIPQLVGFFIFVVSAQAELTQTPFDMPVAESELVAGYMTEYTGFRFLIFFIGEFATAFALAGIGAVLFLGGWWLPGMGAHWGHLAWAREVVGAGVMFAKVMLLGFVIFWVRFTLPRFREDQLQRFAWKFLIPLALADILVTGVVKVAVHA